MNVRDFIAWQVQPGEPPFPAVMSERWRHWRGGTLAMAWVPRDPDAAPAEALSGDAAPRLFLGDSAAFDDANPDQPMANAVSVRHDAASRALAVTTSIVGLPPVYCHTSRGRTVVASSIHALVKVPGVRLDFDPLGVVEHATFGHPVGHRTLFKDVRLLPGGSRLELGAAGTGVERRIWSMPSSAPWSWADFIEAQRDAFVAALSRIDVSRSFLSLTAGLDTRAVFAELAAHGRLIPTATMTGTRPSLDARIAARLSAAYGVRHVDVTFGEPFERDLPAHVESASRLSGGLESLNQAPEVYLYRTIGGGFASRLSGNLGNQVGRGGTEGVSVRGARLDLLAPALRGDGPPRDHWLLAALARGPRESIEFILQQEVPFTLLPNFGVGSHFALQQSPYADRALIETLAHRPEETHATPARSKFRLRLRDLKHRFVGEPEIHSFQRSLISSRGGVAASVPINWGWRPRGGVSVVGLGMGVATFAGMAARAKGLDAGVLRRPLSWSGLPALHDFRESRRWLRERLRDYTMDSLGAADLRHSGLFESRALDALANEHFSGTHDHYDTLTFALDLALARKHFLKSDALP
jgi:asparagine synthase (glutamine-hydrolysing)